MSSGQLGEGWTPTKSWATGSSRLRRISVLLKARSLASFAIFGVYAHWATKWNWTWGLVSRNQCHKSLPFHCHFAILPFHATFMRRCAPGLFLRRGQQIRLRLREMSTAHRGQASTIQGLSQQHHGTMC